MSLQKFFFCGRVAFVLRDWRLTAPKGHNILTLNTKYNGLLSNVSVTMFPGFLFKRETLAFRTKHVGNNWDLILTTHLANHHHTHNMVILQRSVTYNVTRP